MEDWREQYAGIWAIMQESAKAMAELREQQKEQQKESAKAMAELREQQKENARQQEENNKGIKELRLAVGGIGGSNGDMAEEYFYNSLDASKTFAGIRFDSVARNLKGQVPLGKGEVLEGEYDITMLNGDTVGIVEVKYKVQKNDVEKLAKKQIKDFKQLFPMFAKHKFYLGIGGMSFDKRAVETAKEYGVGLLKLKGEDVKIYDKNLKVY